MLDPTHGPMEREGTAAIVELGHVAKVYRKGTVEVPIFDDLSMTIRRGEFLALMGPSGSGKTTLLNLIGGIDRVSAGQILFEGTPVQSLSERDYSAWRARNVGFIFQFYNLMPMLTAAQNVELPLLLLPMSASRRRAQVQTALEIVGLSDRSRHHPRELSGGQQQRVAIARALVTDPALILADEPTGDLDRQTADEVLAMLRLLADDMGKTIVMVTHDQQAADQASRVLHLDKGLFVEQARAA